MATGKTKQKPNVSVEVHGTCNLSPVFAVDLPLNQIDRGTVSSVKLSVEVRLLGLTFS